MELDTTLSIDIVIAILVVFGAVWRLDSKIDGKFSELRRELKEDYKLLKGDIGDLRSEVKGDIGELRSEVKADIGELRTELKGDIGELRSELKADIGESRSESRADNADTRSEIKTEVAALRTDLKAVEAKVDDCNQRLARIEGIIVAREDKIDSTTETNPAA